MIDAWSRYALADFVPYGAEVYRRLVESIGETWWPLHVLTLLLGIAILLLARSGRRPLAFLLLAAAWAWVGVTFFIQRYAELNWAGPYLGGLFLAQAALLLGLAVTGRSDAHRPWTVVQWAGLVVALVGLVAFPLVGLAGGGAGYQAETFGLHPDPTAVATIGIALMALRAPAMVLAVLLPGLWCLLSGAHLQALGMPWWPLLIVFAVMAVAGPLWQGFTRDGGGSRE